MTTTWRTDTPTRSGWFITDRDDDLRRHFDTGRGWSAPVHVEDLDRLGESVRHMPSESPNPEWRD